MNKHQLEQTLIQLLDESLAHHLIENKRQEIEKSEIKLNYLSGLLALIGVLIFFKAFI